MTFAPGAPLGSQEPRLSSVPPALSSAGADVVEYGRSIGILADPWQAIALEAALGEVGPRWAALEVAVVVGRQNGKNGILELRELAAIDLFGSRLVIHTAHLLPTAEEAFRRMCIIIESCPDLDRQVKRIIRTNGKEGIEFKSRARIKYAARSKSSGRGWSEADLLVFDEAMLSLEADAMAALIPSMTVAPNPQIWYTGSAGFEDSTQLLALRERALAGGDRSLAYLEWSADEKTDLDDRAGWRQANPALGIRITEEWIERERVALDDESFARERLGIWASAASKVVIDPDVWAKLARPRLAKSQGKVAFAVDVPPEGRRASLARAIELPNGDAYVEVDSKPGTLWAQDRLVQLWRKRRAPIVIDPGSRAGALLAPLVKARVKPKTVTVRELASACSRFVELVEAGKLKHSGQPELSIAVNAARKRNVGDAWAWHRRDASVDISPLVAATLAVHGLTYARKRRTGRSMAV